MSMSVADILEATGGKLLHGRMRSRVRGVSTDTRHVRKGELFIAIKGDNFDGHGFLAQAVASGAVAVLVHRTDVALPQGVAVVLVKDTVKALGHIARFYRRMFPEVPVIAITGSAGKTTTKELIASVLGTKYRVLYNKGTENNHIGVPSTLLKLRPSHDVAVIEAGTNHFGEIKWLASIIEPTIAVFTNVGPSHLAGLGTPEGVFREKATLISHLAKDGVVIVNADDPLLAKLLKRRLSQKLMSYAVDKPADVRAQDVAGNLNGLSFKVGSQAFALRTSTPANVYNALAAIACGRWLKVGWEDIRRGLIRFRPPKGRQVFYRMKGTLLIDDTYNANPLSFRNAVQTLALLKGRGRAVLVGADMLELGKSARKLHAEVGQFAARQGIDVLLTCGPNARFIGEAAVREDPAMDVRHCETKEQILAALKGILRRGDIVLVKGSRGMRMESVVSDLIAHWKG